MAFVGRGGHGPADARILRGARQEEDAQTKSQRSANRSFVHVGARRVAGPGRDEHTAGPRPRYSGLHGMESRV